MTYELILLDPFDQPEAYFDNAEAAFAALKPESPDLDLSFVVEVLEEGAKLGFADGYQLTRGVKDDRRILFLDADRS